MKYPSCLYLKSPQEMRDLFTEYPEACDNTVAIADRCNIEIDLVTQHAPVFTPPDGSTPEDYLTKKVYEGAKRQGGPSCPTASAGVWTTLPRSFAKA